METRARFLLVGLFLCIVLAGGFVFVYWLNTTGGLGKRAIYRVRFERSVSGLRPGSAVLFNGVNVGAVSAVKLSEADPRFVLVTLDVDRSTPVRADSGVAILVQGFMGSPAVALYGGSSVAPPLASESGEPPLLIAPASAGMDLTQTAVQALARLDKILADNESSVHSAIANIDTFASALSRNSDRIDGILAGLEKMTGGASKSAVPIFSLDAPKALTISNARRFKAITIAEPTTLVVNDTQKILVKGADGEVKPIEGGQWADSLPKLLQGKLIETFDAAGIFAAVDRTGDGAATEYQLLIDLRAFQLASAEQMKAELIFAAKLLGKGGRVLATKSFRAEAPTDGATPELATKALNRVFQQGAEELLRWTIERL
jgi:phospholipid/cholesterol/gamma-HCH transport system substrate-binding protein